ncbi:MAG TPA: hypothetical protein VJV79_00050 [Polyangiaceae bacterium]|nr:hypothetical protein [Polyangiaceae bacterium]
MRLGFRTTVVALLGLLAAFACSAGGGDQCLNPVPEFPSCRGTSDSDFNAGGTRSAFGGAPGGVTSPPVGGASAMGTAGSGTSTGNASGGGSSDSAGSTGENPGAGGDGAIDPDAPSAGASGAAGAAGAAGSLDDSPRPGINAPRVF